MLLNEFIQITGFHITPECYHKLVESEYDASDVDKFKWCKDWKRNGGITKAYAWQVNHDEEKLAELKKVQADYEMVCTKLSKTLQQLHDARENIAGMKEELDSLHEIARKFNIIKNTVM